jgi:hypothetical protein
VGATPTPAANVTGAGPPWVSASAMRARFPSRHTETLRALPRPAQGPLLGTCGSLPGDQEADQEAQEDRESRLTIHKQHQRPPTFWTASHHDAGLNHKLRTCATKVMRPD